MKVSKYWKAVVAAGAAGVGSLSTALADDHITGHELWGVAGAVLAACGFTWWVPNKGAPKRKEEKA